MTSATDVAQSVRKLRQLTERYHAVFIPGHDPEEWKTGLRQPVTIESFLADRQKRLLSRAVSLSCSKWPRDGRGHFCGQAQGFTSSTT